MSSSASTTQPGNMITLFAWLGFVAMATSTNAFVANDIARPAFVHQRSTSLAASNHFDMNELRHRIEELSNPYSGEDFSVAPQSLPEKVHVVMFHAGTERQSAHAIEYPRGSGRNIILAFESRSAAQKFGQRLAEQGFSDPTPLEFALSTLDQKCVSLGVYTKVVPASMEIVPPTDSVPNMGEHNPKLRQHQNYLMYVYDMDTNDMADDGPVLSSADDDDDVAGDNDVFSTTLESVWG